MKVTTNKNVNIFSDKYIYDYKLIYEFFVEKTGHNLIYLGIYFDKMQSKYIIVYLWKETLKTKNKEHIYDTFEDLLNDNHMIIEEFDILEQIKKSFELINNDE
jgi:hypothetical protein